MNNKSATDSLRRHRTVHIYIYARCRRVAFLYLDLSKDRLLSRDAKVKTHNYVEIHFHCFELYSFVRNSLHSFPIVSPLHTVHVHVRLCVNMVCRFYLKFFFLQFSASSHRTFAFYLFVTTVVVVFNSRQSNEYSSETRIL